MIVLWLWMACGHDSAVEPTLQPSTEVVSAHHSNQHASNTWSVEGVMRPTVDAVDANGDGRVTRTEYESYRGRGPRFEDIDLNGDGALELSEFTELIETQDPQTWEGDLKPRRPVAIEIWRGLFHGEPDVRQLSELLRFVRAEVQALGVVDNLPTDAEIQAAAETRSLDSDSVQSLLKEMAALRATVDDSR